MLRPPPVSGDLLVPVLVLAAAIGSVSGGSASGAPVTATAFCSHGPPVRPHPQRLLQRPLRIGVTRGPAKTASSRRWCCRTLGSSSRRSRRATWPPAGSILVLEVLLVLAERFDLGSVGPLISGHSYFVAGTTTPSNHSFGRAVDISVIDGQAVSIYNPAARDAMELVLTLPPPLLPDELGGPWPMYHAGVRTFTQDHHDHATSGGTDDVGTESREDA